MTKQVSPILARTEAYFCPIKHGRKLQAAPARADPR
jgi:hypothetical protein